MNGMHVGETCRMRQNHPRPAAIRPCIKLVAWFVCLSVCAYYIIYVVDHHNVAQLLMSYVQLSLLLGRVVVIRTRHNDV